MELALEVAPAEGPNGGKQFEHEDGGEDKGDDGEGVAHRVQAVRVFVPPLLAHVQGDEDVGEDAGAVESDEGDDEVMLPF